MVAHVLKSNSWASNAPYNIHTCMNRYLPIRNVHACMRHTVNRLPFILFFLSFFHSFSGPLVDSFMRSFFCIQQQIFMIFMRRLLTHSHRCICMHCIYCVYVVLLFSSFVLVKIIALSTKQTQLIASVQLRLLELHWNHILSAIIMDRSE